MQAVYARYKYERRLLIDGVLWSLAGALAFVVARQGGAESYFPTTVQVRLTHVPVQQFSDAFPVFAIIIALSLLCVWMARCGRFGAAVICGWWMSLGVAFEYAQRTDVASWVLPLLPSFFHSTWPFNLFERLLGSGGFNVNHVLTAVIAGIIAYVMMLNSVPNRVRV